MEELKIPDARTFTKTIPEEPATDPHAYCKHVIRVVSRYISNGQPKDLHLNVGNMEEECLTALKNKFIASNFTLTEKEHMLIVQPPNIQRPRGRV